MFLLEFFFLQKLFWTCFFQVAQQYKIILLFRDVLKKNGKMQYLLGVPNPEIEKSYTSKLYQQKMLDPRKQLTLIVNRLAVLGTVPLIF